MTAADEKSNGATLPRPLNAPGIEVRAYWWGYAYAGTRDALIAAGFVKPGGFPGDEGQRPTVAEGEFEGRKVRIRKRSKHLAEVHFDFTPAEREIAKRREEVARVLEREREQIDALPKSADEFKRRLERAHAFMLKTFVEFAHKGFGGYSLSDESLESLADVFAEQRAVLCDARVRFSAAERAREVFEIRSESAKKNPAVQAMLATQASERAAS